MAWFYAEGDNRRGPVTEEQFSGLIAVGTVTPATLVWHQGMAKWQPLRDTRFDAAPPALDGATAQRCFITGKFFPTSQMLETEHGWVSAGARDTYYQCLRESVPFPVPAGMFNARSDGKRIILPVDNPVLPRRCLKTNQPITDSDVKRRKLFWCSPWVALSLFLSIFVFLIIYLIVRKTVVLDVPLSREGRGIVRKHALIAWSTAIVGIVCIALAIGGTDIFVLMLPGVILVLVGAIYGAIKATAVRVVKRTKHEVWLKGACPAYLAELPRV